MIKCETSNILKMTNHTVQWIGETRGGVLVDHALGTFVLVVFKVSLGSFGALFLI